MKNYIKNLETGKIELHFEKSEYQALPADQKAELKRHFLWSRSAWVSRSIHNQWQAIQIANKLGFIEEEKQGERLSFAEQQARKQKKAERRADRFEQYAENAENRGKTLQSDLEHYRGDIAFFTQPIISGHSGSQAFANRRQRIMDRYFKGFDEYRKSEYFTERAETARKTADGKQLKSPVYLNNRIKECEANIRRFERALVRAEKEKNEHWQEDLLYKLEYEIDKLGYFKNCLDEVSKTLEKHGKKLYTREDIKLGYFINVRGSWAKVLKTNPKTVEGDYLEQHLKGCYCLFPYAEIQDIKIPEGWTEETQKINNPNPFNVGDIVVMTQIGGNRVVRAFQIVKKTDKTVTIQRIDIQQGKPIKDAFVSDKQERRTVKEDRAGNTVVNSNDYYLHKYIA